MCVCADVCEWGALCWYVSYLLWYRRLFFLHWHPPINMLLCSLFDLCTHGRGKVILTHRHTRSLPPRMYLTFRFPSLFTLSFGGRMQQQMRITPSLPSCIWIAHSRKFGFPSPLFGGIAFPTPSLSQNSRLHTITIWLGYTLCLNPIFGFEFYVLLFSLFVWHLICAVVVGLADWWGMMRKHYRRKGAKLCPP